MGGWAYQRLLESGKQMVFDGNGSELTAVQGALDTFREQRLAKFIELGILAPAT
ncbi:hypothetical protein D3C83_228750 [compost metagenome]